MVVIEVEHRRPPAARHRRQRCPVEVTIPAHIVGPGMVPRRAGEGQGLVAPQHGIQCTQHRRRPRQQRAPCPFRDRRAGVVAILPQPGVDPLQLQRPPPHRKGIGNGIPFPPSRPPLVMRRGEEGQIGRIVHLPQRRQQLGLAPLRGRLDRPDRLQDGVHPLRLVGGGVKRSVEELVSRPVRPLPLVPEDTHQRPRLLGSVGSLSNCSIRFQRSASPANRSTSRAIISRPML